MPFTRDGRFPARALAFLRTQRFDVVHMHCERANFWLEAADILAGLVADGHLPDDPFDAIDHAPSSVKPLAGVADLLVDDDPDVAPGEAHRLIYVEGNDRTATDCVVLVERAGRLREIIARIQTPVAGFQLA